MRQWISKRQAAIGPNTMMALFANAKKYPDVINLSIGDPDIPTPQAILDAMYQDSCKGHTKYTPSKGDPELIQAVCDFYKEEHGLALGPEWITITPAACSGMYQVMQAVLDPGDEVLIFSPYFSPYASQTQAAGGVPVLVPCLAEEGFQPNAQRAAAYVTPKTKAMIVNTPNNPTGACYTRETLEGLAALAKAADLLVIADDIYTDLCFTSEFLPIMTLPGMRERTVTLGSCSKNFVMTGMRIGWVAAPPEVAEGVRYVGENIIYCAPSPGQRAALYALRHRAELRPLVGPVFRERVYYARDRIRQLPFMTDCPAQGSFYVFPGIGPTGLSSMEACQVFLDESHVLMLPGSVFGQAGEGYMRIACTLGLDQLGEAFDRLEKLSF